MVSPQPLRWIVRAVALAVLGGCGGDNGPTGPVTFRDPAATTASIAALDTVFGAPAIQSFGSLSGVIVVPAPAALGPVGALLGATGVIPRPGEPLSQLGPARLDALRRLRPQLGTTSAAGPIIPNSYYGWVLAWDCDAGGYVQQSSTGGPATGIRFLLYAVDPFTGQIVCPSPTEIGYVDLTDVSNLSADRLRVRVVSGGITYIDYTISITGTDASISIGIVGTIRNGAPGGSGTKTITFTLSLEATVSPSGDVAATYSTTFELDQPRVTFAFTETVDVEADFETGTVILSLQLTRPGESVQVIYTVVLDGGSFTLTGEVRINGQRFATIEGDIFSPTFRDRDGRLIEGGAILEVLTALGQAAFAFDFIITQILAPLGGAAL
jgi:hypothetical protein